MEFIDFSQKRDFVQRHLKCNEEKPIFNSSCRLFTDTFSFSIWCAVEKLRMRKIGILFLHQLFRPYWIIKCFFFSSFYFHSENSCICMWYLFLHCEKKIIMEKRCVHFSNLSSSDYAHVLRMQNLFFTFCSFHSIGNYNNNNNKTWPFFKASVVCIISIQFKNKIENLTF